MVNYFSNKNFRIVVFNHTQYRNHKPIHGPSDTIVDFLKDNVSGRIFYVMHSIYKGDGSLLQTYQNGQVQKVERSVFSKNFPNIMRYAIDFFSTFRWFIFEKHFHLAIAVDPLNFFYAYVLKKFRKVDKIIYYTVDYAYRRFDNPFLNKVYHCLDLFAVKRADMLWNSCKKIREVRRRQGVHDRKNIYLPNTPISHGVNIKNENEIDKFSLVNIFSNHKQVDFDIMFEALSRLIEHFPQITLKLIGRGDFAKEVIPQIKDSGIRGHVKFMDISSHTQALEEISRSAIGLECNPQTESRNEFREPIKIMEYITFGLPIISKPGHGVVDVIVREKIGFVVNSSRDFFEAVKAFLSDYNFYCKMREKVLRLAEKYNKEKILFDAFTKLGITLEARDHHVG